MVGGRAALSAAFLLVFEILRMAAFLPPACFDVSLVSASSYVATARPHDLTVHARTWMSRFFYLVAHPFLSFFLSSSGTGPTGKSERPAHDSRHARPTDPASAAGPPDSVAKIHVGSRDVRRVAVNIEREQGGSNASHDISLDRPVGYARFRTSPFSN
jgi:hypothetical protein